MKTYQLKEVNGVLTLHTESGNIVECIMVGPTLLPHPNIAGQVIIQQRACSNNCPALDIIHPDDPELTEVWMGCIKIHRDIRQPKQEQTKLIL